MSLRHRWHFRSACGYARFDTAQKNVRQVTVILEYRPYRNSRGVYQVSTFNDHSETWRTARMKAVGIRWRPLAVFRDGQAVWQSGWIRKNEAPVVVLALPKQGPAPARKPRSKRIPMKR